MGIEPQTVQEIEAGLLHGDFLDPRRMPSAAGAYAVFEREAGRVPLVPKRADGLIYLGITTDSLIDRCALSHARSSTSTLRRSVGAILMASGRAMRPIPRGKARTRRDFTHYNFVPEDEQVITDWIATSLFFRWVIVPDLSLLKRAERELINRHQPPLNIQHASHSFVGELERLRATCSDIASTRAPVP